MAERKFYLKFFDETLRKEFLEIVCNLNKNEEQISVIDVNGTFKVTEVSGNEEVWEILCHKYYSYNVKKDGIFFGKEFIGVAM